jgi:hypothetical protein
MVQRGTVKVLAGATELNLTRWCILRSKDGTISKSRPKCRGHRCARAARVRNVKVRIMSLTWPWRVNSTSILQGKPLALQSVAAKMTGCLDVEETAISSNRCAFLLDCC